MPRLSTIAATGRRLADALPRGPSLVRDACGVCGLWLIAFGFHEAWAPLGWIAGGLELMTIALLTGRAVEAQRREGASAAVAGRAPE